ncbi:hypothetical protein QFZ58_006709 [Streptomyces sp. B1I3]|nr:hypothetical protein [Streptomyces sp. B1I3]
MESAESRTGSEKPFSLKRGGRAVLRLALSEKSGLMTAPQEPSPSAASEADRVEHHPCPKCKAVPGSPCRSRSGVVASAYRTGRFTKVPRCQSSRRNCGCRRPPTAAPASRGSLAVPAAIDPSLPSADIRVRYARCSMLGQELGSQLDALAKHCIPREKIFSEKISTRVKVRPQF